jgi:hypothetical protein
VLEMLYFTQQFNWADSSVDRVGVVPILRSEEGVTVLVEQFASEYRFITDALNESDANYLETVRRVYTAATGFNASIDELAVTVSLQIDRVRIILLPIAGISRQMNLPGGTIESRLDELESRLTNSDERLFQLILHAIDNGTAFDRYDVTSSQDGTEEHWYRGVVTPLRTASLSTFTGMANGLRYRYAYLSIGESYIGWAAEAGSILLLNRSDLSYVVEQLARAVQQKDSLCCNAIYVTLGYMFVLPELQSIRQLLVSGESVARTNDVYPNYAAELSLALQLRSSYPSHAVVREVDVLRRYTYTF